MEFGSINSIALMIKLVTSITSKPEDIDQANDKLLLRAMQALQKVFRINQKQA